MCNGWHYAIRWSTFCSTIEWGSFRYRDAVDGKCSDETANGLLTIFHLLKLFSNFHERLFNFFRISWKWFEWRVMWELEQESDWFRLWIPYVKWLKISLIRLILPIIIASKFLIFSKNVALKWLIWFNQRSVPINFL